MPVSICSWTLTVLIEPNSARLADQHRYLTPTSPPERRESTGESRAFNRHVRSIAKDRRWPWAAGRRQKDRSTAMKWATLHGAGPERWSTCARTVRTRGLALFRPPRGFAICSAFSALAALDKNQAARRTRLVAKPRTGTPPRRDSHALLPVGLVCFQIEQAGRDVV
jgi:hypothetical protein